MADTQNDTNEQTEGQHAPTIAPGTDGGVEGKSEGEIKALRDDAGLNTLAGHQGNIAAWAASPAGKEFEKQAKENEKQAKAEAKSYNEQFKKDDLTEAEVAYQEALKG